MTQQEEPAGPPTDYSAGASATLYVSPRSPRKDVVLPLGVQHYGFTLDNDLIKLVALTRHRTCIDVRVRYAVDAVLQDDTVRVPVKGTPMVAVDGLGVVISWRAPLIPGFDWPTVAHTRRF